MKKLLALAAFLLASSTAQAQYQFEYGGRTIKIDPDRGTVSIPGVYDNTKKAKGAKTDLKQPPATAAPAPSAPAVATQQPPLPPPPAPAPAQAPLPEQPATTTANNAPPDNNTLPPPPPPAPPPLPTTSAMPPIQTDQPPTPPLPPAPPAPAPTVAAMPPPPPPPAAQVQPPVTPAAAPPAAAPPAAAPVRDPNSPLGVWQTEEKEGKIRIEQCGANLCGYSVDAKTNLNGEQVLINMKPGKDQKWSGRILDPNTGSTYDSSISLKGPDSLRVQGCAFGGMFCGGQNWTRVN
jgi:uncharacterized protein (DUF2147 family)